MRFLRRILYWALRPALRLALRFLPPEDPWERFQYKVPVAKYGMGAKHDFSWYFEGESRVPVDDLEALCGWLISCEYVHDSELFHEPDFWQHPRTFELLRRGDCEDHALWAWRKLVELGYDADLVSGRCLPWTPGSADDESGHAWIIFRRDGGTFLFETVAKDREGMIRPLGDVASAYRPEFGVDRNRGRFVFNGFLDTMRDREFGIKGVSVVRRTA